MKNVYFVVADGAIKIGFSANVSKRMAQLQTGAACKLKLLAIYPGADRSIEKRLHETFADFRLEGEWFRDARIIRKFAALIAGGARPVDLSQIKLLAELARVTPDKSAKPELSPEVAETKRQKKVANRPVTFIPTQFIGTAQQTLIEQLDAMTRDPTLPIYVYGRAHAALRKALKGEIVDIPKAVA